MPIEIKELIIRARVEPTGEDGRRQPAPGKAQEQAREEMIRECVAQVMEILRRERER